MDEELCTPIHAKHRCRRSIWAAGRGARTAKGISHVPEQFTRVVYESLRYQKSVKLLG